MTRFTTLLIDMDETLFDFAVSERQALCEALEQFGIPADEPTVDAYHRINGQLWKRLERGETDRDQLIAERFRQLLAYVNRPETDAAALNRAYMHSLSQKRILFPGVQEALERLCADYDLYIITNGTASVQRSRIADKRFLACFEGVFLSEEIGEEKPSPGFFGYVLSHIREKERDRVLVVGDSLSSDIAGGLAAGLSTCWMAPDTASAPSDLTPTFRAPSFTIFADRLLAGELDERGT